MPVGKREVPVPNGLVVVREDWYEAALAVMGGDECPFCGSGNVTVSSADDVFEERRGCVDCDRWFGPLVQKDEPKLDGGTG